MAVSRWRKLGYASRSTRLHLISVLMACVAFSAAAYAIEENTHTHGQENTTAGSEHVDMTNTLCPVVPEMKADPDIFTEYQGKRIYFCCPNCRATFIKSPEQYLSRLPQFAKTALHAGHEHEGHDLGAALAGLIKPAGFTTLSLLGLTVAAALLCRKSPRLLLKWHKRLGITTLAVAATHAILVLIAH
ncbi:MAG: hypothetical protein ACYS74_11320 [Planctomycetota bacterium]